MVAAGYFNLSNLFYAMALERKKIAGASRLYGGFPTIARRLIVVCAFGNFDAVPLIVCCKCAPESI